MSARRAVYLAPFDELADPRRLAELAVLAQDRGWDGFFLWDHVRYSAPTHAVLDPWVALGAIAMATEFLTIGPLVTPLPRRRIQKLARETATLDLLSQGRLVLGVGIGSDRHGELAPFGEVEGARERGRLLDDGLAELASYWDGVFLPRPVQRPRIPVWCALSWPSRRPLARAARWDGLFPVQLPDADALAELVTEARALRDPRAEPLAVAVANDPETDVQPWLNAGATWLLTNFGQQPRYDEVRAIVDAGPA
jgi:alkanesulfonate monooxygenase SsuD/methylene tetrahydromethanopterin reductase-like flavin-dependent oxidoreductase (luciferase family)